MEDFVKFKKGQLGILNKIFRVGDAVNFTARDFLSSNQASKASLAENIFA